MRLIGRLIRLAVLITIPLLLVEVLRLGNSLGDARTEIDELQRDLGLYHALAASSCVTVAKVEDAARAAGWNTRQGESDQLMVLRSDRISMKHGPDATFLTFGPDGCLRP